MMTVKSMTATFGKLEKARLTCTEGLNLIHAPNEGGKSTWAAFYKAMLFGIDTRERDRKGYLAPKNRYQPWSGSPMEGELLLDWNGREIAIRRGPRGTIPFGSFSAVYTDTGEAVPGMTGETCGELLTGVSREVFERSAFIGGDDLPVTPTPDLERRITALLTAGQEDVSFSETQATLKEWLNRRKVNRTVGLIPKLEEELVDINGRMARVEDCTAQTTALEVTCDRLAAQQRELEGELEIHHRLAAKELNARYARAESDCQAAERLVQRLERDMNRSGSLPPKEELKRVQFDLQYLKVLDGEIKNAQTALEEANESYIQAQTAAQDEHFPGLSGEEVRQNVTADQLRHESLLTRAKRTGGRFLPLMLLGVLLAAAGGAAFFLLPQAESRYLAAAAGVGLGLLCVVLALTGRAGAKKLTAQANAIPGKYGASSMEELLALAEDYTARCAAAQAAADHAKTVRGALNDLQARKENSRTDIFDFVHQFAPEVKELFGCSAALSRALNLDHEYAAAVEKLEQCRLRRDDLLAQGGQPFQTLELLHTPERTEDETRALLNTVSAKLDAARRELDHARGRMQEMEDPAALYARREQAQASLARREQEYEALSVALVALNAANESLRQRFSPKLNALTGDYFSRLTDGAYHRVTLNRDMEGETTHADGILPRTSLYLSRGTTDQLYLAVRLAVCDLCLPQHPPILLDDALTAFDDERLALALSLLKELSQDRQILLFTCQKREKETLEGLL